MSAQKNWVVIEPTVFIHSGIFVGAILRNEAILNDYRVEFLTTPKSVALEEVSQELRREFGPDFSFRFFQPSRLSPPSSFVDSLKLAWGALASACQMSRDEEKVDLVTVLWADRLVKLLAIPGVSFLFRELKGRVNGLFFNARCFRESGLKAGFYRWFVLRGIRSGYFKNLHFLDHGARDLVCQHLPNQYHDLLKIGVDPWPGDFHQPRALDPETFSLLTFGAHSKRKGTISLLKMLRDFPEETASFRLSIIGRIRDDIRQEFEALMAEIKDAETRILIEDRFVADTEMVEYFSAADVILCPYVDFHGSSNVVIRAAGHSLPVVVPPFGYLGELVAEKKIGEVAEQNAPAEILAAICKVESNLRAAPDHYHAACESYASFHRESEFAVSLVN